MHTSRKTVGLAVSILIALGIYVYTIYSYIYVQTTPGTVFEAGHAVRNCLIATAILISAAVRYKRANRTGGLSARHTDASAQRPQGGQFRSF